jgi:hypothetical protein
MTDIPSSTTELRLARQRADLARENFTLSLQKLRDRITPDRIKNDALTAAHDGVQSAKSGAQSAVRRHPWLTAAATISALLLLFWKPARFLTLYAARGAWFVWLNRAIWSRIDD